MVELLNQTREQLVEELQKKEASRVKLKEKLVQLKELSVNTAQVLQLNRKLEQQVAAANKKQQASTKECEALRSDLKAAHDLTQEANTLLTEQERNQQDLQQQLTTAKTSARQAQQSCQQAQAAKSKSEMAFKSLELELAALRRQLAHFQAGLKSVEQQQKADHQDIIDIRSQAPPAAPVPAPAPILAPAHTCQGCGAVQQAVVSLQKQLHHRDLASAKGSTKANSAASTQDHSGDTLDDRSQVQMRAELRGLGDQLLTCQDKQQQFETEMHRWRTFFGSFAALAAPGTAVVQASSDQMQISPAGAEGSNIVPRPSPEDQNRREQLRAQPRGQSHPQGHPAAGIAARATFGGTAGELKLSQPLPTETAAALPSVVAGPSTEPGEVMAARVNSTGAESDTFSAAAGTNASLMLPATQTQPPRNINQARLMPQSPAIALPDVPRSPKRKTIALQPGAARIPDAGRKRRKLAKAGQADQGKVAPAACHVTQQQQQQALPSGQCVTLPHLAQYDAPVTDAVPVDIMEIQLARICNTQDQVTASLVSAVAQDICTAWQAKLCPLECIVRGFVAVLLDCAAASAPAVKQSTGASMSQTAAAYDNADKSAYDQHTIESGAFAKLWCSRIACQQRHFTWLMHCAEKLDRLLSSPARAQPSRPPDKAPAAAAPGSGPPSVANMLPVTGPVKTGKKRGRPPGSKNKKTLLKLQQQGLSCELPGASQAAQPPAASLPQQQSEQMQSQQRPKPPQQQQQPPMLPEGALLEALHRQALACLGQACQMRSPGPFETEVCCLSAAAASLARLQGKIQAVRAHVVNTLCSDALTSSLKLESIAAAVEVWPEALLPPSSNPDKPCRDILHHLGLLGTCVHAHLQHSSHLHAHKTAAGEESKQNPAAEVTGSPATSPGPAGRQLLLSWNRNRVTSAASHTLVTLLGGSWQQQAKQQLGVARQQSEECDLSLCQMAGDQVLAELKELGTTEETADGKLLTDRWADLGLALQLMTSILGWEWVYEQVLNKLMGPIVSALLRVAAGDSGQWAVHSLQQMLPCMTLTVKSLMHISPQESTACAAAVEALLQRLRGMAQNYANHALLSRLMFSTIQSMQQHIVKVVQC